MFAIQKQSKVLAAVVYEGGQRWSPAKPFAKPMTFKHRRDAEAMARGLGDGAEVVDLGKQPMDWD